MKQDSQDNTWQSTEMGTVSGMRVVLNDVDLISLDMMDIAIALSNICRFGGHVDFPYTVMQHSMAAYYLAPPEHKGEALLHDAAEAYIGDVIVPMKNMFPEIAAYEHKLAGKIFQRFLPDSPRISSRGEYVKSPFMTALDRKLALGESYILRRRGNWGAPDSEVSRMMETMRGSTPYDFINLYSKLPGAIQL